MKGTLCVSDEYGSSLDVGKSRGCNRRGSQPQDVSLEESGSKSSDLELESIKKASISREHVEVRRDRYGSKLEVDDDEYEDSSFINDDRESDANSSGQSFPAAWQSTFDSGEGSKSSGGSLSSRGSSEASRFAVFLLGSGSDSLGPVTKTAAQLEQRFGDGAGVLLHGYVYSSFEAVV